MVQAMPLLSIALSWSKRQSNPRTGMAVWIDNPQSIEQMELRRVTSIRMKARSGPSDLLCFVSLNYQRIANFGAASENGVGWQFNLG
jgi:hypothetical protein